MAFRDTPSSSLGEQSDPHPLDLPCPSRSCGAPSTAVICLSWCPDSTRTRVHVCACTRAYTHTPAWPSFRVRDSEARPGPECVGWSVCAPTTSCPEDVAHVVPSMLPDSAGGAGIYCPPGAGGYTSLAPQVGRRRCGSQPALPASAAGLPAAAHGGGRVRPYPGVGSRSLVPWYASGVSMLRQHSSLFGLPCFLIPSCSQLISSPGAGTHFGLVPLTHLCSSCARPVVSATFSLRLAPLQKLLLPGPRRPMPFS